MAITIDREADFRIFPRKFTQSPKPQTHESFAQELRIAIARTRQFFLNAQCSEGNWVGELEGDCLLESEAIMLFAYLGEEHSELSKGCAKYLLEKQLPDGGWGMYTGAKSDVTNTVKGYFALKLAGHDPSASYMQKARNRVMELGGADRVNSFTRFYLALLGQIPYDQTPAVPPQMTLLPNWLPINIYAMSSWSRAIFVALSIVSALAPVKQIAPERGIRELFVNDPKKWPPLRSPGKSSTGFFTWDNFFRLSDKFMWACRKIGFTPLRKMGIQKALDWTLEHFEASDGPGAIQPPIVWAWIALKTLGYTDDSPEVQYCRDQFNALVIWDKEIGSARIQPCKSPVWDTSLTLKSLLLSGMSKEHPQISNAVRWLLDQQISRKGDWANRVEIEPGGWAFEYNNEFYPDNDDTAMALMILGWDEDAGVSDGACPRHFGATDNYLRLHTPDVVHENVAIKKIEIQNAISRGLEWLLAMQNKDGGWAAFDKDNTLEFLCKVPFADHNAMIDPSSPDLTGRVMESLGRLGFRIGDNGPIDKVVAYMRKSQLPDGSFYGRWGVHYIYGTWQALTGLSAVGVPNDDLTILAGVNWLLSHQQPSGGWGESPLAYDEPNTRGQGNPTASQTAWAVMGLIAAGKTDHSAVYRGIRFLLNTQCKDGTWNEPEFTGTGFPSVFYLRYHYYSKYFPLMALSMYTAKCRVSNVEIQENRVETKPACIEMPVEKDCVILEFA